MSEQTENKVQIPKDQMEAVKSAGFHTAEDTFEALPVEEPQVPAEPEPVASTEVEGGDLPPADPEPQPVETEAPAKGAGEIDLKKVSEVLGAEVKRDENGNILMKGKQDGNDVWAPVSEFKDSLLAHGVIDARFREAAETRKEAQSLLEQAKQAKKDSEDFASMLATMPAQAPAQPANDDFFEDGQPAVQAPSNDLQNQIAELNKTVTARFGQEDQQKQDANVQAQLQANIQASFKTVADIIVSSGQELPPDTERADVQVLNKIATECGGIDTDAFKANAQNPNEIYRIYKELYGGKKFSSTPKPDGRQKPPQPIIPSSTKSQTVSSPKETLEERKAAILDQMHGGPNAQGQELRTSYEQTGTLGAELQSINQKLEKLKEKGG